MLIMQTGKGMYCVKCGNPMDEGAIHCMKCGIAKKDELSNHLSAKPPLLSAL
jgi:hypothetical protein